KIDVCHLSPATDYYYRFMVRGVKSPVGRMRTAPAAVANPSSVRFGLVSCSNFEAGYFTAYRHLAGRDDLDFILHVGDYIYEYANGEYGPEGFAGSTRAHDPATEILSLSDYRRRHACYKADADLRELHARHPFITTWDDHETANNAWRDGAENHTEGAEGSWAERKAAGIKAYFEWMPIRTSPATGAVGEVQPVYRKFSFGSLVDLFMLDLRQYRSEQPLSPADAATINDPTRTMLGAQQSAWLQGNLATSSARWKLMGNSVQIAPVIVVPSLLDQQTQFLLFRFFQIPLGTQGAVSLNTDSWDGYARGRLEILGLISGQVTGRPIGNCVFLTGDIHSTYAGDIPANPVGYNPASSLSLGTEFVCTSVTSDNVNEIVGVAERVPNGVGGYIDNPATAGFEALIRGFNSWVRDVNLIYHGYSVVDVNSQRTQVDTWILRSDSSDEFAADPRIDPAATCILRNSYQTLNLSQKVTPAAGPLGPRA
ncbi:MAG: alkaline phosphatase D family protein, partial [Luteolibacter sp.]